jgi:hypothetical protein
VEFTSGVLQGYYVPLLTDIARHLDIHDADVNWLEAAQLMLSAGPGDRADRRPALPGPGR